MAARNDQKAQAVGGTLRGGTEGGEAARLLDPSSMSEGTPESPSPAGGTRSGADSVQQSITGLADRAEGGPAGPEGGRSREQIRGYLRGLSLPALEDAVVREARRNGAPDDVLGYLPLLPRTEYASLDEVLLDYPRLDESDASSRQGR